MISLLITIDFLVGLTGNQVKKKTGEILFTCKAWNGRVVCEWLAATLRTAAPNYDPDFDHGCLSLACAASTLADKKSKSIQGMAYMGYIWGM